MHGYQYVEHCEPMPLPYAQAMVPSGMVKAARFLFYLTVLTIPFVSLAAEKTAMGTYLERVCPTDILGGIFILLCLASGCPRLDKSLAMRAIPFLIWVYLGVGFAFMSPEVQDVPVPYRIMGPFVITYVFLLADSGSRIAVDPATLKRILIAFTVAGALEGIIIVHDSLGMFGIGSVWFSDPGVLRIRGTFRASGQLGQFGMAVLFIGYAFAAWPGMKTFRRIVVLGIAGIGGLGAYFASRRSAVYCIILWLILLAGRSLFTRSGRKSILSLLLILIIVGVVVWQSLQDPEFASFSLWRYTQRTPNPKDLYAEGTWHQQQVAETFRLLSEHPILGCGLEHARLFSPGRKSEIHNGLLAILAETGLVGTILMFVPLVLVVRKLISAYRMSRGTQFRDFVERLTLPFFAWMVFSIHNRIWRDRGFWIAVIAILAIESALRTYHQRRMADELAYGYAPPAGQ